MVIDPMRLRWLHTGPVPRCLPELCSRSRSRAARVVLTAAGHSSSSSSGSYVSILDVAAGSGSPQPGPAPPRRAVTSSTTARGCRGPRTRGSTQHGPANTSLKYSLIRDSSVSASGGAAITARFDWSGSLARASEGGDCRGGCDVGQEWTDNAFTK